MHQRAQRSPSSPPCPYTGGGDKEEVAMLVAGGLYIGVEQLVRS
jgi:hypothetical protein